MKRSSTLGWIALALAGLAVSAGASLAASRLAGQRIGLDSEPIQAGDQLAPRPTARRHDDAEKAVKQHGQTTTTTTTQRSTPTYTPPATSGSGYSGSGSSGSRSTPTTGGGGGGDDGSGSAREHDSGDD